MFIHLAVFQKSRKIHAINRYTQSKYWSKLTYANNVITATHLCRHSLVVMVLVSMSRQMGHVSSDFSDCADTAISVSSVMASCGVLCSS